MLFFKIKDYDYEVYSDYTWRNWVDSGDQGSEDFKIRRSTVTWEVQSEQLFYEDGSEVMADDLVADWISKTEVEEPAPEEELKPQYQPYTAGEGITISAEHVISNSGVRSVSTGTLNGHVMVNKNGIGSNVKVKGLNSAAYKSASDFAPAYSYGTEDLVEGNSSLATGKLYFVHK